MPGSRKQEIKKIFPVTIDAANKLAKDFNMQAVIACSTNLDENFFYQTGKTSGSKVVKGNTYDLMKYAKFGIIKSGTSTLEAGFFEIPMIVVYKTSVLTYMIGKKLIRLNNIGMVNIVLNSNVVPELIQKDVTQEKVYKIGKEILTNEKIYSAMKEKLSGIKLNLGTAGASARAAEQIYTIVNET